MEIIVTNEISNQKIYVVQCHKYFYICDNVSIDASNPNFLILKNAKLYISDENYYIFDSSNDTILVNSKSVCRYYQTLYTPDIIKDMGNLTRFCDLD
ncbi:MAG: hypothetical protein LBU60_06195 [Clostridiales bacterium]|nr:hypothetical protein [Clostridiales bacterium]